MKISELMSNQVFCISQDESAAAAARLLSRHNIGVLPVCENDMRIVGVVTDRDIVLRCVAADFDPQKTKVREIMTNRVISLAPEDDVSKASMLMGDEQIRRIPICKDGKLIGILSLSDMIRNHQMEAAETLSDICCNIKEIRGGQL